MLEQGHHTSQVEQLPDSSANPHSGGSSIASTLDVLAKGLASGTVSRGKAIRLVGGALLGAALASFPGLAWADDCKRLGRECRRDSQCCSRNCVRRGDDKVCACPEGQTRCNDRCVNRQTNERHCGRCFNRCAEGEQCVDGACQDAGPICDPPCPEGQAECMEDASGNPFCQPIPICDPPCRLGSACYFNQDGTTFCACGFGFCTNDCSACAPGDTCAPNPMCPVPTPFQCVTPC